MSILKAFRGTVFAALLVSACSDPTVGRHEAVPAAPAGGEAADKQLVVCPTDREHAAEGVIGVLGGALTAGGTTINIPAGAVLSATTFKLVVPASKYMEVTINGGLLSHFDFEQPVSVTIDYSRCPDAALGTDPLTVFYVDDSTKTFLENMGGTDDRAARKITFITDHLSGYAIAN
ncbi:MAG TPA: hypothetical protein VFT96_03905 [Gemmatimonadaceae bacterium]|nr:hypothetical protein [Gemmatimonadaceae bacterium]